MDERNAALNTGWGAAHDKRTVTLTREQWELVAYLTNERVHATVKFLSNEADFTILYSRWRDLNRAICEQAGLGEEFRCE